MYKNYLLLAVLLLLLILVFVSKKERFVSDKEINEEVNVTMKNNDLVTRIQLNTNVTSGDNWINLGDITIRDKRGAVVNYGNTNDVYFGNRQNWGGLPVQNLWDDSKVSISASNREVENLIINLPTIDVGSVQITNRQDCCWHRIGGYRLSIYGKNNEEIGMVNLDKLVGQGKTVRYNLVYP